MSTNSMKNFSVTLLTLSIFGVFFLLPQSAYALTPPTFIQEAETSWTDNVSSTSTASFTVQSGDVLVAFAIAENYSSSGCSNDPTTISGGSLTWNNEQTVQVNNYTWVGIWTATVDTNKSMTVTISDQDPLDGGCTANYGVNVLTFRNAGGIGASSKTNVDNAAPTLNITTTAANSAIVVASGDWNAVNGSSRTWRTNAGAFTEKTYNFLTGKYTVYGGYHADAGAVGTYAVGLSAPGAQRYSIVAVEVKGTSASARIIRLKGGIRLKGVRLR